MKPSSLANAADPDWALEVTVQQTAPMPLSGAFKCKASELLALVGPSGAGKTSMLRMLAGLMQPQHGRVVVNGQTWLDTDQGVCVPPQHRRVGLVFQDYALMPHLDALHNVALALLHLPATDRLAKAQDWLTHVQLSKDQQTRRPNALSGGQRQRVAMARALARAPRLLLLDEPFSAVDLMTRQGLYRLLADLRRDLAIPIVLVTHDLNEARLLADNMVVMDAGHVLQQGRPEAIHRAPRNARVADLVGIHNRFEGLWLGPACETGWGYLAWTTPLSQGAGPLVLRVRDKGKLAVNQRVTWVIPGDGLHLLDHSEPQAPNEFQTDVTQARNLGEMSLATLQLCAAPSAELLLSLAGTQKRQIHPGQRVTVQISLETIHVMPLRETSGARVTQ